MHASIATNTFATYVTHGMTAGRTTSKGKNIEDQTKGASSAAAKTLSYRKMSPKTQKKKTRQKEKVKKDKITKMTTKRKRHSKDR